MFSEALRIFIRNPIVGIPNVAIALVSSIISFFVLDDAFFEKLNTSKDTGMDAISQGVARASAQLLFFLILTMLVEPIVIAITARFSMNALDQRHETFHDTLRYSLRHYWRLLGVLVFKFFLLFVVIIGAVLMATPYYRNVDPAAALSGSSITSMSLLLLIAFVVLLITLVLCIMMIAIEPILIYDSLSLGDAIVKGFRFGFRKFFPIVGAALVMLFTASFVNYVLSIFIGVNSGISTVTSSFLSTFVIVYILSIYKASKPQEDNMIKASPVLFSDIDVDVRSDSKIDEVIPSKGQETDKDDSNLS